MPAGAIATIMLPPNPFMVQMIRQAIPILPGVADPAVPGAIGEVDHQTDRKPYGQPDLQAFHRQTEHQEDRGRVAAPHSATIQIAGDLNGLTSSGSVTRSISVPIDTTAKANSVPMLTSSPTSPIGSRPAKTAATKPVPMVAI